MYKVFLSVFLFFGFFNSTLADKLNGVWVQDIDSQNKFNYAKVTLSQDEMEALSCSRQKMFFDSGILITSQKELACDYKGKEVVIPPLEFKNYYRILASSDDKVAVEMADVTGKGNIEIFYFIGDDIFWSYYYGDNTSADAHLRVYYRRKAASP